MRDGDWRIGLGCAGAAYPSNIAATAARVRLSPNGGARVEMAGCEIGQGAYTVVAITAADRLGLAVERVLVELGDTALPPASLAAGSSHTASITHAVAKACDALRDRLAGAATADPRSPLAGRDAATLCWVEGAIVAPDGAREPFDAAVARLPADAREAYAENVPQGSPPDAIDKLNHGEPPIVRGTGREDVTAYGFGAQFVEVRVHALTGEVRVPRMVGAFAAGRIVNPLTARSQYMGGMIWGIGAALLKKTEIDRRSAAYVNVDLAEYHVPVNADVGDVEVIFVPDDDCDVNPLGIKGVGELGIVGVNAVHHATGKRIRRLPIRVENMI